MLERFECGAHSFQSTTHCLSVSAKPNAEVLRLFEKFSRYYAGLEPVTQHPDKFVRTARLESWKHRCSEAAGPAIELRALGQKFVHQRTIRFEQRAGATAHAI